MDFDIKAAIVGQCWLSTRPNYIEEDGVWTVTNAEWVDFHRYADIGLPLAFAISNSITDATPEGQAFVEEAYKVLLDILGIPDGDYYSFNDLLNANIATQEE